jgi:hypothetical protein
MREFLVTVEKLNVHPKAHSPVAILDILSKKELENIIAKTQAIVLCTIASHIMQIILSKCFTSMSAQKPTEEIKISAKHLH